MEELTLRYIQEMMKEDISETEMVINHPDGTILIFTGKVKIKKKRWWRKNV